MTLQAAVVAAVSVVLGLPAVARAGEQDFLVYAPGMGASATQARPYLDKFGALLDKRVAGGKGGPAQLTFLEDGKQVADFIDKRQPGYALLPASSYLELACRKVPVTPLAAVVLATTAPGAATAAGRYHVIVKSGGGASLADLKGKRLASNHLQDLRYVSQVILGGALDVSKDVQLRPTSSPISPFKWVDRGEADAALVDDAQLASMKTLPFGQSLAVIFSSEPTPPSPIVSFDKVVKPADRAALRKAVIELCDTTDGGPICKEMQVKRFEAVDAKAYQAASQRYCRP